MIQSWIRLVGDRQWLIHSMHLPTNRWCKRGEHRKNPTGFVQSKYSKSSFSATKWQFSFELSDSKHSNHNLKVLHDLTKKLYQVEIFLRSLSMASFPFVSEGGKPEQPNWPIANWDWRKADQMNVTETEFLALYIHYQLR